MKKIISLIICLIMVVSVFGGCMLQKKDGVAITVGDTQMTTSEFAYYVYMCKAQLAQEQGVTLGDEATEKEFLDAKNGDVTNKDVIVENAVKHGIRKKAGKGNITISTYADEDNNYIKISDDGIGFDINSYELTDGKHVGIKNVSDRIYLMTKGSLDVESTPGVGTTVVISIPKKK